MKPYRSFKEIDKQLEILKLERTVHKLKIHKSYHDLKESLSFQNIVGSAVKRIFNRFWNKK